MSRPPLKARPHAPICRVSPPHLVMHGFFVAAVLALVMGEC
nr:L29 [uncultured bacterium]